MQHQLAAGEEKIVVSVIVLTYNHEAYIRQALDGILCQKVPFRYEILVGDDASDDETPTILQQYQALHPETIRLFLRKKNVGPTRNAYELFTQARGDYIATCEGDDYWTDENKLQLQVGFLEAHPEYIGCSHPCLIVDEHGQPTGKEKLDWECTKETMKLKDFKGWLLPGQVATLVRRNIYKDNLQLDLSFYYRAHAYIGDRTTGLMYLSQGDFYRMDRRMSAYRIRNDSRSLSVRLYYDNSAWIQRDWEYTQMLMDYAKNSLRVKVNFHCYLRHLCCNALWMWVRKPSKETWLLFWEIFKVSGCPLLTLGVLCRKVFRKLVYSLCGK